MKEKIIDIIFTIMLLIIIGIALFIIIAFSQEVKPKLEREDIYYLNL